MCYEKRSEQVEAEVEEERDLELEDEDAELLPSRDVMSVVDPTLGPPVLTE